MSTRKHTGNILRDRRQAICYDALSAPVPIGDSSNVQSIIRSLRADERVAAAVPFIREHPSRDGALVAASPTFTRDVSSEYGGRPVVRYIGSDRSEDRHVSILEQGPDAVVTKFYEANNVFCWGHQYGIPIIGNCVALDLQKTRTVFDIEFAVDDWDLPNTANLARLVYRLASKNRMPASSVGFIPLKSEAYEAEGDVPWFITPTRFLQWELLELSSVAIPSNRNALKKAIADGDVSENEIDFLGLKKFMLSESTYVLPMLPRANVSPASMRAANERHVPIVGQRQADGITRTLRVQRVTGDAGEATEAMTQFVMACGGGAEATRFLEAWRLLTPEQRKGAVLSRRNMSRLQNASDLIDEVLTEAQRTAEEEEEANATSTESNTNEAPPATPVVVEPVVELDSVRAFATQLRDTIAEIGSDSTGTVEPEAASTSGASSAAGVTSEIVNLTQLSELNDLARSILDFRA